MQNIKRNGAKNITITTTKLIPSIPITIYFTPNKIRKKR